MYMNRTLILILLLITIFSQAQSTKDILVGGGFDILKTDIVRSFDKAQLGVEGNYFVVRHFAVGAGLEYWTAGDRISFAMGARYYFNDNLFVRFRGLIGANEAAIGVGYSHPIKEFLRVEAMGDFYAVNTEFAIRAGVAYVIKMKNQ